MCLPGTPFSRLVTRTVLGLGLVDGRQSQRRDNVRTALKTGRVLPKMILHPHNRMEPFVAGKAIGFRSVVARGRQGAVRTSLVNRDMLMKSERGIAPPALKRKHAWLSGGRLDRLSIRPVCGDLPVL